MKMTKRSISLVLAVLLCLSTVVGNGIYTQAAEGTVDSVIRLTPGEAQTFNDTNGDGLGEFEGFGTSLCWWANRVGYSEALTEQAAEYFFSDKGLDMNIGRYNVGGGDKTTSGSVDVVEVPVNAKAKFYGISDADFTGKEMKETTLTKLANATYAVSDADFGFTKGYKVGNISYIGWINELGAADDASANGGNLHFNNVEVAEAGSYTVKLLLTLSGTNNRGVGIKVNGTTDYMVDTATINANTIATVGSGNDANTLFIAEISDVQLNAGVNKIDIGGDVNAEDSWTLDFVKMAVIKSDELGVMPESDPFLHKEHIIRSDSGVPGYCVDVTKMDLTNKTLDDYADFDAVDEESGYAWNYDWTADQNQLNILKAAIAASGEFHAEAFSNSPPYFMTVSGCSSGNVNASVDNLRSDCYTAFATYMADVIKHWNDEGVINFASVSPMNEPYTNYWGANSNKQEGCHFDQGNSQSKILVELDKALNERGIDIIIAATDETSIDTQITSYKKLSDEAKAVVDRIDTHTYSGSKREELRDLAKDVDQNLWMSEVDGAFTGGTNSGEMSAALGLAGRMMTDLNGLQSTSWILWNAIDMHADNSEYGQSWVNKGSANDYLTIEELQKAWGNTTSKGYWGLAAADHNNEEILLTMKYYGYGQLSRYIRPGYTLIGTSSTGNTVAAYDSENNKVVVVAMNTSASDQTWNFDLSLFNEVGDNAKVTAIRTSGSMADGEKWADVSGKVNATVDASAKSVTADMKANSITTFIIEDVTYDPENPIVDNKVEIDITEDMITGSEPWGGDTANGVQNLVDGNQSTFFDGQTGGYAIIDLGKVTDIDSIAYAPRTGWSGYQERCVGAVIAGSVDGEKWDTLYTITKTPGTGYNYIYAAEFESGSTQYRYIKYSNDQVEANLAELKVFTNVPEIESVEPVYAAISDGETVKLPTTVTGYTKEDGSEYSLSVTWNVGSVNFDEMELFEIVEISGFLEGSNVTATAIVAKVPANLEYLIDCHNPNSSIWAAASKSVSTMINTDAPDQAKTDDNQWGYTFVPGVDGEHWDYEQSGNSLLEYGYWAYRGKALTYEVTLPAGTHNVMVGGFDFWNNRTVNITYSINGGDEEELCKLSINNDNATTASGTIVVEEDNSVVTISAKKYGDNDPILGCIVINEVVADRVLEHSAHYDMSNADGKLTDISGNENHAALYNAETSDFSYYGTDVVLGFNNKQYAEIPSGVVTDAANFTIQTVVKAPTTGDNWLWCIGDGIGEWGAGNISDYIFMSTNSSQGSYAGTVLGAVKVGSESSGGESRMPVPTKALGEDFVTLTVVSNGDTLTMYMDGVKVSELTHGKDLSAMIPDGDILGYIGQSLYSPDKKLIAEVADMQIWNTALTAKEVKSMAEAVVKPVEDEKDYLQAAFDSLDIPNKDDVRGNITLPAEMEGGVTVTWTTSHSDIVDLSAKENEGYDSTPAGVVTRPSEDTTVTMTATLTYNGETKTKEFTLNVKAAPAEIKESDYTDYFFAYFAGEGYADGEQIYFASSQDGLNWDDLNNNNPVLTSELGEEGVRDPFIIRSPEGDKFYMIATDLKIYNGNGWDAAQNRGSQSLMIWESTDLVNWSEQRMVEVSAEIGAGCTWAPEATYDPTTGEYVVYWASRTPAVDSMQRMYYAKTRDFYTFTEPELFIEKDESSIDTTIIENNGTYYRYTKNEGGSTNELGTPTKSIFIEKSDKLLGTYTHIPSESLNARENQYVEGPTIFKLNEDDAEEDTWCLLVDDFGGRGYYPLVTSNLESGKFESPAEYQMPSRARHGTPIRVTAEEYANIMNAYGSAEPVNAVTTIGQAPVLPETVTMQSSGQEKAVTWNLDDVSFDVDPFKYVEVTGTVEGSSTAAIANVQVLPENLEYMIDCANPESTSWKNAVDNSKYMLNTEAADQAKTDENTWGYTSVIADNGDMAVYSGSSVSNPYTGGYWARGNKNITYQVTLPAGEHTVMLGSTGWWGMGRQMDVFYSVDGGEEVKLCDFDAVRNAETYAQGTITLEEEAVVTLSVKKAANDDSILSWIAISGIPTDVEPEPVLDFTALYAAIADAKAVDAESYTEDSYAALTAAVAEAEALLETAEAQEDIDAAVEAIENAINALVEKGEPEPELDFAALNAAIEKAEAVKAEDYTEASYKALTDAVAEAEALLETAETQAQIDAAADAIEDAIKALVEKEEVVVPVDKSKLQSVYEQCLNLKAEDYTEESYKALLDAMDAAKAVLDNEKATQYDVSKAYSDLEDAVKALVDAEKPGTDVPGTDKPGTDKPETDDTAKTGDSAPIVAWSIVLVAAAMVFVFALKKRVR